MRIYVMVLTFQYVFFSGAFTMEHYFQRAMLANAVVCALRVHQRIPSMQLSRAQLAQCLQEDSAHYLIYSFIFLMSAKSMTLALVPVFGYALLHACHFSQKIISECGQQVPFVNRLRSLTNTVAKNQSSMFQFISMTEIIILPTIVLMVFKGQCNLVGVIMYYKFITFRYMSRRNPYTRMTFHEGRRAAYMAANNPSCPGIVKSALDRGVALCCRLAPAYQPQQ